MWSIIFVLIYTGILGTSGVPEDDNDENTGIGISEDPDSPCGLGKIIYGGIGFTNARQGALFNDAYLPSCSCYQDLFEKQKNYIYDDLAIHRAKSGPGGYGEFEGYGDGDIIMPGVNCVDKSHDSANEPEKPKIVYKINLNRTVMTIKENEYFTAGPDNDNKNSYEYIAFIKEVNDESPLKIAKVSLKNDKNNVYDSTDNTAGENMKDICESHTKRSIEDNLLKILKSAILDDSSCPITEGSKFSTPKNINPFLLTFSQKMPCGNYLLNYQLDTPDTTGALILYFIFEISEEDDCTAD
ncbi:uncharacterized protein LOC103570514 [Microplitis demolitor]|uniref:uncharacterized protein LOC103570514 n=1 Tax=Microplitis demolitor TaxID=69319 RepID=UPI0004CCF5A0|nr:uncharacterized protein LOC103570514 [Microplitis demolitor]